MKNAKYLLLEVEDGCNGHSTISGHRTLKGATNAARKLVGGGMPWEYLGSREPSVTGYSRVLCYKESDNAQFAVVMERD